MEDPTGMLGDRIRDASAGDWRSCWLTAAKQRRGAGIFKGCFESSIFLPVATEKNVGTRGCKRWAPQRSAELKDRWVLTRYLAKALLSYIMLCCAGRHTRKLCE